MSLTSSKMVSQIFQPPLMPQYPFASNTSIQGRSPTGSSTGDSSSGRAPFTPRDGSDIGVRSKDDGSDMRSMLNARGYAKKTGVRFEDPPPIRGREGGKIDLTSEQRTRERRRNEAKAAIQLGKIANDRRPLLNDNSDKDAGLRRRSSSINMTTENGVHGMVQPRWAAWQQPMVSGMIPMVPPQLANDPAYLAAHQRALLIAKQTYQMVVAQHAMQMANEEWERSSNIGFWSGGSVYSGGSDGSVYGGGSEGSVYGGGGGGSVCGCMGGMAPMGMMNIPDMGMLMTPNQWPRSFVSFPTATGSVYGRINSSPNGPGGAGGWGMPGAHGDSFGSSSSRSNCMRNDVPKSTASAYDSSSRPRVRTGVTPSSTSSEQPTIPTGKSPAHSWVAPPSSWKSSR